MPKGTFNYDPDRVQGGGRFQSVTQGPAPRPYLPPSGGYVGTGLIAPPTPQQARYLTKELEERDRLTCSLLSLLRKERKVANCD